jgi:hypothetical protein
MGAHVPRLAIEFCKLDGTFRLRSFPPVDCFDCFHRVRLTEDCIENLHQGFVVELVDTSDSKPDIERCASSTLAEVTNVIRGESGKHA